MPAAAADHARQQDAHELDRGDQVHRQDLLRDGFRHRGEGAGPADPGARHEQVDPVRDLKHPPRQPFPARGGGEVLGQGERGGVRGLLR
jgi:hypothetical protein